MMGLGALRPSFLRLQVLVGLAGPVMATRMSVPILGTVLVLVDGDGGDVLLMALLSAGHNGRSVVSFTMMVSTSPVLTSGWSGWAVSFPEMDLSTRRPSRYVSRRGVVRPPTRLM